jgi:hypothetical protein
MEKRNRYASEAGNLGDDVPPGTLGNILRQAGLKKGWQ